MDRKRVQKFFTLPSKTKQEFKDDCDLGKIIKRFSKNPEGLQALLNASPGRFEDVSNIPDYRTYRDILNRAEASFMALPAIVRKRFGNDAASFVDFCKDPKNLGELRTLGLARPEVVPPVVKA